MHYEAMRDMRRMLRRHMQTGQGSQRVLDVGSLDVNGNYRGMVEALGCAYVGLDVVAGPNVDVVADNPYRYPFDDGTFDVVISGSTMEHVQSIWLWVPELARVLRPGGMLAIVTHHSFAEHRYPVDCWRIMSDGMAHLFDLTGCLERYDIRYTCATDIAASAYKAAACAS